MTNTNPIISLILPAYNVESFIESCVMSCEEQDLEHDKFEIIIVNDGSTDNTTSMINRLSDIYTNIYIINQENQGLSMARNNGAKVAKGKYIWFIDGDDTITTNCLATLIKVLENLSLDVLTVGPSIAFIEGFPKTFDLSRDISAVYRGDVFLTDSKRFVVGAWCYILKRDFWEKYHFEFYPGITYEDTQLIPYMISKAERVAALTTFSCYNYIQRMGSIMNSSPNKRKVMSQAVIVNTHLKFAEETGIDVFLRSASGAFIGGLNMIAQMGGGKRAD